MKDINELSVEEKVGQLIIGGFNGLDYNEEVDEMIVAMGLSGVILFKRNYKSVNRLGTLVSSIKSASMKSLSGIPPFISVDHEGGRVMRFGDPFTHFPSSGHIARNFPPLTVRQCHMAMARELAVCGINMSYSPLLDVNINSDNPVIGDRAFGHNSETVYKYAKEVICSLRECNVIPVGKHFPGHGNTNKDSHFELPVTCSDLEMLENLELLPFVKAIKELNIEALMTAHVMYPCYDEKNCATMSKTIITELLKSKIGFSGVVISDDLEMKAVEDRDNVGKNCIDALNAGVDMFLICHDIVKIREARKAIIEAIEDGKIDILRINDAVLKIIRLKESYTFDSKPVDAETIKSIVGCELHMNLLKVVQKT